MAARISYSPGENILEDGAQADFVFGVSAGVVRLFKLRSDGGRQIISLALPGDFLELPLVSRHMLSATAVDKVSLHRFPRASLKTYILSNPNLMRLLVEFATRQLELAQDHLLTLGTGSAEERDYMAQSHGTLQSNSRLLAVTNDARRHCRFSRSYNRDSQPDAKEAREEKSHSSCPKGGCSWTVPTET
jgi:CRP-like cAMP-binding protein